MKTVLSITFILLNFKVFAQSPVEAVILKLSKKVFTWEVENKIDSLDNVFDDKFLRLQAKVIIRVNHNIWYVEIVC